MAKNSPNTDSRQMSFLSDAARQDPEQTEIVSISQQHNFPLQRCILPDGREMYAVQDWIAGVARPADTRVFWQQMKKRLLKSQKELYSSCIQLPYQASNGKTYQMDYADGQTLYGITQHMGVDTGIRNQVLSYLAKTGAFVDAARQDPEHAELAINQYAQQQAKDAGKDAAWIAVREMGKVTRKQLCALLLNLNSNLNIGIATNKIYEGVFDKNTDALNTTLGLKPKSNPREHMSRLALMYTMVAEEAVRVHLVDFAENDILPLQVVYNTVKSVASAVGIQAQDMARQLHVDIVTGQKLLGSGR